jgi:L-Ala-D/L-Glu epimerase
MEIKASIINLKNKHVFKIAHGSRTAIDTVIVELFDGNFVGLGEATPVPYYGVTAQKTVEDILLCTKELKNHEFDTPKSFYDLIGQILPQNSFARCALDIAAHDLWSKKQNLPLYKSLGLNIEKIPLSNYTIGIDEIPIMIQKMKELDFPIYKIKLGTSDDLNIVKELRKHSDAVFRVDANCAWTVNETLTNAKELKNLGVEFIEQPLKYRDIEGMRRVYELSELPLIADESCILESDVDLCKGLFHGVNIKLAKCGGISPALRMISNAKSANMKVMMGCMTESSVGISAIAHLLPLLDYVDMDGALMISNDPAIGVEIISGQVRFTNLNGIGAKLKSNVE